MIKISDTFLINIIKYKTNFKCNYRKYISDEIYKCRGVKKREAVVTMWNPL